MKKIVIVMLAAFIFSGCAKKGAIDPNQNLTAAPVVSTAPVEAPGNLQQDSVAEPTTTVVDGGGLKTILFAFDSHLLTDAAREILRENARWLQSNPGVKVQTEGHADEQGAETYNLALGEKRAQAAHNYLLSLGVAAERLSIISYGEERPAVQGTGETAWAHNRRAEFVVRN